MVKLLCQWSVIALVDGLFDLLIQKRTLLMSHETVCFSLVDEPTYLCSPLPRQ